MYAVIVLILLCTMAASQNDFENSESAFTTPFIEDNVTESTTQYVGSNVICETCSCDEDTIDCSRRDIDTLFGNEDWEALSTFQPTTLIFEENPITRVTKLPSLPTTSLDLSHCNIQIIDKAAFVNLKDLVSLDLSWNEIATSAINKMTFCGRISEDGPQYFTAMRILSLAHNDIHSLQQGLFFFMPHLTSLDLSGNPLVIIDQVTMAAITELAALKELRLSGCELESLPEGFFKRQRRLSYIDLSDNRLTIVPAALKDARNLVYLNLDKNPIEKLDETSSSGLTKLRELHLCRLSKLTNISAGALGGLQSLSTLHICYNPRLTTIDPAFLMWEDDDGVETYPALQQLYLNNNNISEIDPNFLDRWDQLTDMDFGNNNFICDCERQWMIDVLVPLINSTGNDAGSMICKTPRSVRGMSYGKLYELSKTLECPKNDKLLEGPGPNIAMIFGIIVGILATFPLVFVTVLLWRRGYFARCRGRRQQKIYSDEENDAF